MAPLQTDKNNKVVFLYTPSVEEHFTFVKKAKERGYEVLEMNGPLVPHWISKMEQAMENISFARVDADTLDKLISKSDEIPSKLSKEEEEKLKGIFEGVVSKDKFTVQLESMSSDESPILITQPEFIRRMMEQQKMGGGGFYGAFPEMYNLVVNANHPTIEAILTKESANQTENAKYLADLAMLSQGMLKGEPLDAFIEKSLKNLN